MYSVAIKMQLKINVSVTSSFTITISIPMLNAVFWPCLYFSAVFYYKEKKTELENRLHWKIRLSVPFKTVKAGKRDISHNIFSLPACLFTGILIGTDFASHTTSSPWRNISIISFCLSKSDPVHPGPFTSFPSPSRRQYLYRCSHCVHCSCVCCMYSEVVR